MSYLAIYQSIKNRKPCNVMSVAAVAKSYSDVKIMFELIHRNKQALFLISQRHILCKPVMRKMKVFYVLMS